MAARGQATDATVISKPRLYGFDRVVTHAFRGKVVSLLEFRFDAVSRHLSEAYSTFFCNNSLSRFYDFVKVSYLFTL